MVLDRTILLMSEEGGGEIDGETGLGARTGASVSLGLRALASANRRLSRSAFRGDFLTRPQSDPHHCLKLGVN